jgi:hypothetical protein
MSKKMISVEESFVAWRKQPEYEKTYNALEDEFSLAAFAAATGMRLRISFEPAPAT